jgi:hypothetical protein
MSGNNIDVAIYDTGEDEARGREIIGAADPAALHGHTAQRESGYKRELASARS